LGVEALFVIFLDLLVEVYFKYFTMVAFVILCKGVLRSVLPYSPAHIPHQSYVMIQ
jgi:hypothetical protein